MLKKKLSILIIFHSFLSFSQSDFVFIENKGQWDSRIVYNQILPDGNLYFEKDGFTYALYDKSYIHNLHHDKQTPPPDSIKSHTIKTKFVGCNEDITVKPLNKSDFYYNYFHGNDESKWKSSVKSCSKFRYQNIYDDINLLVSHETGSLKYDFVVERNGNPNSIKIKYEGADELYLEDGKLIVKNTVSDFFEAKPYAYQLINGKRKTVVCNYLLNNNILSYDFPNGYDSAFQLIIDPLVIFSSFTGSTADNFGFTATYDKHENTYVGGIVYGNGIYPTTVGAFQTSFNTSASYYVDIAISKFNQSGSNLIYSTYLGGNNGSEAPHSLVVTDNDELIVMGSTGSSDFPTTVGAYDRVFGGGVFGNPGYSGVYYFSGCDIVVAKFNSNGTGLIGSTYIGGTGNDGLNTDTLLNYNYGDGFRGEVITDVVGNAYVTTTTNSINFPTTAGSPQTAFGGGFSDACVFQLNSTLQSLTWSSFHGGSEADAGYGIQFDSQNNLFVTGGTRSANFSTTVNAFDTSFNGAEDGFISKINLLTNSILASTFIGTPSYDQSYFIQLDINDDVYITGQSEGSYPVSSGVYSNPGSKQFFHKLTNNLDSSYWSTVVGSGRPTIDFSPSAFLVNDCGHIYLSGWGGVVNRYLRASGSSTAGLAVTSDGFQLTTDNSDFYLMVLGRDAANFMYGTYYGGNVSHEHVDGGTSRFDKNGNVYQAICAGCGGNSDLPTTPGAWSRTNNSTNCNLGVIKLNVSYINSIASSPSPVICLPDSVSFLNNSSGGNSYKWYFGDGDSSFLFEPNHVYLDSGNYLVTLIVFDSTGCIPPDTGYVLLRAYKPKKLTIDSVPGICLGDSVQLIARNGINYTWTPSQSLSNDTVFNPISTPIVTTTYRVVSNYYCNNDTAYVTVVVDTFSISVMPDTVVCHNSTLNLWVSGGATYNWYPTIGMTNSTTSSPTIITDSSRYYFVEVTGSKGCVKIDSVFVDIYKDSMNISPNSSICLGDSVSVFGTGGGTYNWTPSSSLSSNSIPNPIAFPQVTTTYVLSVTSLNGCSLSDSVEIIVYDDPHTISPDTGICDGFGSTQLNATGGVSFVWSPSSSLSSSVISNPIANPLLTTIYSVIMVSPNGCDLYDTVEVFVNKDTIEIKPDTTICEGETINLWVSGGASYNWYPTLGMTNSTSATPTISPVSPGYYYVQTTSAFGCEYLDSIYIDFHNDTMSISPNSAICLGDSVSVFGTGGGIYNWFPSSSLSSNSIPNPIAFPQVTTTYVLSVTSLNGCSLSDSVEIIVYDDPHTISPDTGICDGFGSTQLNATGGVSFVWSPSSSLSSSVISNPIANPLLTTIYSVIMVSPNGCDLYDTVEVFVNKDTIEIKPDTTICEGETINLWVSGGASYNWYPTLGMTNSTSATPTISPVSPGYYYVQTTSAFGCEYLDSIYIDFHNDTMSISPNSAICLGDSVFVFGTGGGTYNWSPSSSLSSNSVSNPSVFPLITTTYILSVISPNGCLLTDSVEIVVHNDPHTISSDTAICAGFGAQLNSSGGGIYSWSPASGLSSTTISNPIASPLATSEYILTIVSPNGCVLMDTVEVLVHEELAGVGPNDTICIGDTTQLIAFGGNSYTWLPSTTLSSLSDSNPRAFPVNLTHYTVNITTPMGCVKRDSVSIIVDTNGVYPVVSNDETICFGDSIQLVASGGLYYSWSPLSFVSSVNGPVTNAFPGMSMMIYVDVSNNCYTKRDSINIDVVQPNTVRVTNDTICLGDTAFVFASQASSYYWNADNSIISGQTRANLIASPTVPTIYELQAIDSFGCVHLASSMVELFNTIDIVASDDVIISLGEMTNLFATGGSGDIHWTPESALSCATCRNTQAFPDETTEYSVMLLDSNGCTSSDSVLVQIGGVIRLPNSFTPNGDGFNDLFFANGLNITFFKMQIFNRWGEIIFATTDINQGWDGTHKGKTCKTDSYVWKISYSHLTQPKKELVGHVNLFR